MKIISERVGKIVANSYENHHQIHRNRVFLYTVLAPPFHKPYNSQRVPEFFSLSQLTTGAQIIFISRSQRQTSQRQITLFAIAFQTVLQRNKLATPRRTHEQ